eukprot:4077529-Lingulodinium_polyedra.AAC.1
MARYRDQEVDLWPSVRRELRWAAALLPVAWADLRAPWHGLVQASDASEEGRGVVQKFAGPEAAAAAGR